MGKNKNNSKLKVGDRIYYLGPNGVEEDVAMIIDGQEITTQNYGCIYKRNLLSANDPRVIEFISKY